LVKSAARRGVAKGQRCLGEIGTFFYLVPQNKEVIRTEKIERGMSLKHTIRKNKGEGELKVKQTPEE